MNILSVAGTNVVNDVSPAGVVLSDGHLAVSHLASIITYFESIGRSYTTDSFVYSDYGYAVGNSIAGFEDFLVI